jgi:hypothetical protein
MNKIVKTQRMLKTSDIKNCFDRFRIDYFELDYFFCIDKNEHQKSQIVGGGLGDWLKKVFYVLLTAVKNNCQFKHKP